MWKLFCWYDTKASEIYERTTFEAAKERAVHLTRETGEARPNQMEIVSPDGGTCYSWFRG